MRREQEQVAGPCPVERPCGGVELVRRAFEAVRRQPGREQFLLDHGGNLSGLPAAVVPCGMSPEGLPIGVQIATQPWREDLALAVARHLEAEFGGWQAPPLG